MVKRRLPALLALALTAGLGLANATPAGAAPAPGPTTGPCAYTPTPDDPAARPVPLPRDPRNTPAAGTIRVDLSTNLGVIPLELDRAQAPCTVQSFLHLVRHRFYDRTICHRLTAYPTLSVLQCGDPSGTGEGGPGYRYRDELPTGLPPAPTDPTGERRVYARGVLAMANAGPDTNGSQFFLVYADSALRPNYTIFGRILPAGLRTVDRVAAGGVTPAPEDPAPVDGPPALRTEIRVARVRPLAPDAPSASLDHVHTVSRVQPSATGVRYTWPGTYFEGRFNGTGVGLVLNDATNDYDVQVDGTTVATLVTPGKTTHWVRNLKDGHHTVRLAKRTESPWAAGEFGGLIGTITSQPVARTRQIEFIGDSWTAGYGNMSTTHDCSSNGGIDRNTNADVSFGALTARGLNADYQINAWSGRGMVRNYNGQGTDDFRTYYDTDLQAAPGSQTWQVPATWRPQVVVIGLGINDFSTALNPGERWATTGELAADFRAAYLAFIEKLRIRYGTSTSIVLTYPDLSYQTTALADSIQQIVKTRTDAGDNRVGALYYDNNALGLDLLGCDWHPSQHDHQVLATKLTQHLATLQPAW